MKKKIFLLVLGAILLFGGLTAYASTGASLDSAAFEAWYDSNAVNFNVPYNITGTEMTINGADGRASVAECDLYLPGKNGLDLNIVREYESKPDIARSSNKNGEELRSYLLARYTLPNGDKKLVKFFTADQYYGNNADEGIYVGQNSVNTTKVSYTGLTSGEIYLPRDTTYTPNWDSYDTIRPSYYFTNMNKGKNRFKLDYDWFISLPYFDTIVDPYNVGSENKQRQERIFRLSNGETLIVSETYEANMNTIIYYNARFRRNPGYEMLTPYSGMSGDEIIDQAKGITYLYSIKSKNGMVWYYDKDGYIVAEEDKYGNMIKYQYADNDDIIITDTMGRTVTLDYSDKKITVTADNVSEDVVYYDSQKIDNVSDDFDDYYTDFIFKVIKPVGNESKQDCDDITQYLMTYRANMYNDVVGYTPYVHHAYLLNKIVKPDGASLSYDYSAGYLSNSSNYPISEYFVSHSEDITSSGDVVNKYNYTYNEITNAHTFVKIRENDNYTVTNTYAPLTKLLDKTNIVGDGVNEEYEYRYDEDNRLIETIVERYAPGAQANSNVIAYTYTQNEYDDRGNISYTDDMINEVWYDYGTKEDNPYNILLLKTYENNGVTYKEECTLTTDKKGVSDFKIYAVENETDVLKSHTSYEYDSYGNIIKITEHPYLNNSNNVIEHFTTYTYDLPSYSVENYTNNVTAYDGTRVNKISTLQEFDKYGRLEAVTDGNGNKTTYTYDRQGRLLKETNPDYSAKTYTYDVTTNSATVTNEIGTKMKMTFDLRGRELETFVLDPETWEYVKLQSNVYDATDGMLSSVTSMGAGNKEVQGNFTYDDAGRMKTRVVKQKEGSNFVTVESISYTYSEPQLTGDTLTIIGVNIPNPPYTLTNYSYIPGYHDYGDNYDVPVNNQYDYFSFSKEHGALIVHGVKADGSETLLEEIVYSDSEDGFYKIKGYEYVRIRPEYIAQIDNLRGYTEEQVKAMTTSVTSVTQGDSTITPAKLEQTYDLKGNLVKQRYIDPNNASNILSEERWTYDDLGNNLTYRNSVSNSLNIDTVVNTYDYAGRVLTSTVNDNVNGPTTTTNTYDGLGRLTDSTNTKNSFYYTYDELGRVKTENHYANRAGKRYKYDNNGNVIEEAETTQNYGYPMETYNITNYTYDNRNRLVKVTQYKDDTTPQITQYFYDHAGNVLRMYTGLSAPLTITGPDFVTPGSDTSYSVTKYSYNYLSQLISTTDPLNKTESYTYDYLGNILTNTDRNGNVISRGYNWRGQPLSISSSSEVNLIGYTYDILGNVKSLYDTNTGTTNYTYNSMSQLVSETKGTTVKEYTYNSNGARTGFQLTVGDTVPLQITYSRSNTDTLNSITSGGKTVSYTYDVAGNLLTEQNGNLKQEYVYNQSNYITQIKGYIGETNDKTFDYSYKSNGQLYQETQNGSNRPLIVSNYDYDQMNRLVTESNSRFSNNYTFTYDDNSNRSEITGEMTYQYDSNNRLTRGIGTDLTDIIYSNENNGNRRVKLDVERGITYMYDYDSYNRLIKVTHGGNTYTYEYDGTGHRTSKTVNGVRTDFIWDGDYIVAEITGGEITTYVRGTKLHFSKKGDTITDYFYNAHGDVVQLLDSNQNVIANYFYDAFGNQLTETTNANPFRYCGEYYDTETGLIYLRNRYYDPSVGRFITEDPIKDGTNWYVYCENNPVNRWDPWGLDSYIFYVESVSVDDRSKTTFDEATIWKTKMEEKYGSTAYRIKITSAEQFVDLWDSLSKLSDVDSVVIIAHGLIAEDTDGKGVGYAAMGDVKLYAKDIEKMKPGDYSADDLSKATMKELIFSTCNSANPDVYNLAYGFKINNIITGNITAWDGGTVFSYSEEKNVRGGGKNYFWQTWEMEETNQYTWWKWVQKDENNKPVRNRMGERIISGK